MAQEISKQNLSSRWDIADMLPVQILSGQMSPRKLTSVKDGHRKLNLVKSW